MKSIRITALGAAALALSMPMGFSLQSEAPAASGETEACACTCAVCVAKHGAKAEAASKPAPNLPELSEDIDAEVARILAMDLDGVDVFAEIEDGSLAGLTTAGVAEIVDVTESTSEATSDERGYMGISLGANEEGGGAMVGTVNAGSPAAKAGLKPGDLIVAAEGMPLESNEDLIAAVIDLKVGQTATLEIERGDEELELDIVLGPQAVLPNPVAVLEVPLAAIGYSGDDEESEEEVVLPEGNPVLLRLTDTEEGNTFVFDSSEAPELRRRIVLLESDVEDVEEEVSEEKQRVQLRWTADSGEKPSHAAVPQDALPDGYIEVYTRRERRPGDNDELRRRMHELELEVAELSKIVAELRAELDRRNPR